MKRISKPLPVRVKTLSDEEYSKKLDIQRLIGNILFDNLDGKDFKCLSEEEYKNLLLKIDEVLIILYPRTSKRIKNLRIESINNKNLRIDFDIN